MVIRCERCSTMYELDKSLLAPEGSPVQCTKCQHVFTAVPPRSTGRTLVGVPPPPPDPRPEAQTPAEQPAATTPSPRAGPPRQAARSETSPARVPWNGAPAVYRPPGAAVPGVGRAPLLKRDTVGAFEARLRWSARWRWLAPALAVSLLVAAGAAWLLLVRSRGAGVVPARSEALALVARDDAASLESGVARLAEIVRRAPELKAAAADRALALALRAGALAEESEALAARLAARTEERERLRRETPEEWEATERAVAAEIAALESEVRDREERARALVSSASEQLHAVRGQVGDTPEVLRALAALHVVRGERDEAQRLLRSAREAGRRDPWLDLSDGWLDARDPERSNRSRALVKLGALVAARPDLIRARYLLARAHASVGRRAEALATLESILKINGRHEAAKRLHEELSAVPPVASPAPAPAPVAEAPPPPRRRKRVPQPVPDGSAAPRGAATSRPHAAPSQLSGAPTAPAPEGSAASTPPAASGRAEAPAQAAPAEVAPASDAAAPPPQEPPAKPRVPPKPRERRQPPMPPQMDP